RTYKRTLGKVKLVGRTVKQVHREAEGSLLAVQLLLAQAAQGRLLYGHKRERGSGGGVVLEMRRGMPGEVGGEAARRPGGRRRRGVPEAAGGGDRPGQEADQFKDPPCLAQPRQPQAPQATQTPGALRRAESLAPQPLGVGLTAHSVAGISLQPVLWGLPEDGLQ